MLPIWNLRFHTDALEKANLLLELLVLLHVGLLVPLKVPKNSRKLLKLIVELFLLISHFLDFFTDLLISLWMALGWILSVVLRLCIVSRCDVLVGIWVDHHLELLNFLLMLKIGTSILFCFIFVLIILIFKIINQLSQKSTTKPLNLWGVDLFTQHIYNFRHHLTSE